MGGKQFRPELGLCGTGLVSWAVQTHRSVISSCWAFPHRVCEDYILGCYGNSYPACGPCYTATIHTRNCKICAIPVEYKWT
jgi:hypothetical protein